MKKNIKIIISIILCLIIIGLGIFKVYHSYIMYTLRRKLMKRKLIDL